MLTKKDEKEIAKVEELVLSRNKKKSIESLSVIVFGIALSIGTFTFITSDTKLVLSNILTFAFSFFVIIYIWMRYTRVLEIIKVETTVEILLNVVLLFLIVIEPYLFNQVQVSAIGYVSSQALNFTSFAFALDIASLMFVLGAIYFLGVYNYKGLNWKVKDFYNGVRDGLFLIGAVFLIADLPIFWSARVFGIEARFVLWGLAAFLAMALREFNHFVHKKDNPFDK